MKPFRPTPQHGLIRREPTQLLTNDCDVVVPPALPLADALTDDDLLSKSHTHLRAGDRVHLLRFADDTRQRLVERAQLVVVQSTPRGVDFKLSRKIEAMPEPAERERTAAIEEKLTIVTMPHPEFKLVEEREEQGAGTGRAHAYSFFRVEDGPQKTLQIFDNLEAAQEFFDSQVKSFPDFVVLDSAGKEISPRFRDKRSAEQWLAQEHQRRQQEAA
jgi:hypothetical protein